MGLRGEDTLLNNVPLSVLLACLKYQRLSAMMIHRSVEDDKFIAKELVHLVWYIILSLLRNRKRDEIRVEKQTSDEQ